jgi:hypothetical protein
MYSKKKQASSSIRFRRWSRVGYAVFCSLACTVTIGCLAVSISDKSLQKAVRVSGNSTFIVATDAETREKSSELLELESRLQNIQETSLLTITSDSAVACYQVINIYLLIKTVEMSLSHLNRFLFYSL